MAKLNYLHTDGAKIVDSQGQEVKITGVSWFGLETDVAAPHGLWSKNYKDILDVVVQTGFNTIRLPYANEILDPNMQPKAIDYYANPDLKGLNGLQVMDKIIAAAGERGLKIILDQHRPTTDSQSKLWYTEELSENQWIRDWRMLARRYIGNDTVIGADLHNEPAGDATWGTGDPKTDWRMAAEKAGNAILDVNPNWLIVVEGIEKTVDDFGNVMDWYWMGGSLQGARVAPVNLKVPNRLVYSAHDYGPSVYLQGWFQDPDFPENLPEVWDHHWGYLAKEGIAPVLLGEFGGRSVGNDAEGIWQRSLVQYLKDNNIGYTYWSLNGNSGDTGGILGDDWKSYDQSKVSMLANFQGRLMAVLSPNKVDTSVSVGARPALRTVKALHMDVNKDKWSEALTPEVWVANKGAAPLDLGGMEERYWFTADGDASQYVDGSQSVAITGVRTSEQTSVNGQGIKAEIVKDPSDDSFIDPLYYVKVTFPKGLIVPPRQAVGVALRIWNKEGSTYYQENDYSRREYHWYTEWERVMLYKDGQPVWGVDPQTYKVQQKQKQDDLLAKIAKKIQKK